MKNILVTNFIAFCIVSSIFAGNEVGHGDGPYTKKALPFPKPELMKDSIRLAKAEVMKSNLPPSFIYDFVDEIDQLTSNFDRKFLYIPSQVVVISDAYAYKNKTEDQSEDGSDNEDADDLELTLVRAFTRLRRNAPIYFTEDTGKMDADQLSQQVQHNILHHILPSPVNTNEILIQDLVRAIHFETNEKNIYQRVRDLFVLNETVYANWAFPEYYLLSSGWSAARIQAEVLAKDRSPEEIVANLLGANDSGWKKDYIRRNWDELLKHQPLFPYASYNYLAPPNGNWKAYNPSGGDYSQELMRALYPRIQTLKVSELQDVLKKGGLLNDGHLFALSAQYANWPIFYALLDQPDLNPNVNVSYGNCSGNGKMSSLALCLAMVGKEEQVLAMIRHPRFFIHTAEQSQNLMTIGLRRGMTKIVDALLERKDFNASQLLVYGSVPSYRTALGLSLIVSPDAQYENILKRVLEEQEQKTSAKPEVFAYSLLSAFDEYLTDKSRIGAEMKLIIFNRIRSIIESNRQLICGIEDKWQREILSSKLSRFKIFLSEPDPVHSQTMFGIPRTEIDAFFDINKCNERQPN